LKKYPSKPVYISPPDILSTEIIVQKAAYGEGHEVYTSEKA
jgi:hypothetical protein